MSDHDPRLEAGFAMRRAVLGDAHVDRAHAAATDFTRDFQDFITRTAWNDVWTRPGLDRKTRSMITIAMMTALGRFEELELHVRATRNTGVSRDEVREILLHAAVYAGVPVANSAYKHAAAVYAAMDADDAT